MKTHATTSLATLLLMGALTLTAVAQPVRNSEDVVWARDAGNADLFLDGSLWEPVWQTAEKIPIYWNMPFRAPGDGQKIEGNPLIAEPTDPINATLYVLRKGNLLWMGVDVPDKSIGGATSLWALDGIIMAMLNPSRQELIDYEGNNSFTMRPSEHIYGWFHQVDTTDTGEVVPGIKPRFFGDNGTGWNQSMFQQRTPEQEAILNWEAEVNGTSNDDTHGDDVGYQLEFTIDVGLMGYDFTLPEGDKVAFGFAVNDVDYNWPYDENKFFRSRVWFQNQWANNFNEGVAYIYGAPGVTVSSGPAPQVTEPELTIWNAGAAGAPTVDGDLSDAVWQALDNDIFLQYKATPETMAMNTAKVMKYYHRWYRPNIEGNVAVIVDPSLARAKMAYDGDVLYIAVDVDDQAISGIPAESGRDGIRFTMRQVDSLETDGTMYSRQFDVSIDSSGAVQYGLDALDVRLSDESAFVAAAQMKGASTPADPSDIDEGYTLEIAIDLPKALGYAPGLGDRRLWFSTNFFDGDFLESPTDSYATRVWSPGERSQEASIYAYLSDFYAVAAESEGTLPQQITLDGNYPNPFNPTTTVRFGIPENGQVSLLIYDVLGRQVQTRTLGTHAAGSHQYMVQLNGLASGMYLYRIELESAASGRMRSSDVGQMILLK